MERIIVIAAGIGVVGTAVGALSKWVIVPIVKFGRTAMQFFEDFYGSPARPGVEARPGVLDRLKVIEHKTDRAEFHLGNGNPVPLRSVVEQHTESIAKIQTQINSLTPTPRRTRAKTSDK